MRIMADSSDEEDLWAFYYGDREGGHHEPADFLTEVLDSTLTTNDKCP